MSAAAGPSQPRFIDSNRLELVSVIGTGAYGVVYLALDTSPHLPQPVHRAVKALRRTGLDARQKHFQRREIALHGLASGHTSIVAMDRIVEEGDMVYVVMEFGDEGDLFAMITERQRYVGDDELIRSIFLQLLDGVAFLHSLGIAHRDIKPENIVCSAQGTRVQICDFGLATSESVSTEFGCGSTFYIAPECLGEWFPQSTSYPTRAGDVWSLGIILVNLVCGRNPWRIASPSDESFGAFLKDPNFLRKILPISSQCLYVLEQIFTVNPADRISLHHLRKLVMQVTSFSMSEQEALLAHAQAQQPSLVPGQVDDVDAMSPLPEAEAEAEAEADMEVDLVEDDDDDDDGVEWDDQYPFAYDDDETPSLRADSGSPSPPAHRSHSASSLGSLPPTPLLGAEDKALAPLRLPNFQAGMFDMLKPPPRTTPRSEAASPDVLSTGQPDPFFR